MAEKEYMRVEIDRTTVPKKKMTKISINKENYNQSGTTRGIKCLRNLQIYKFSNENDRKRIYESRNRHYNYIQKEKGNDKSTNK